MAGSIRHWGGWEALCLLPSPTIGAVTERSRLVLGAWSQRLGERGVGFRVAAEVSADEFQRYQNAIQAYRSVVERPAYELLCRSWDRLTSMRNMYMNLGRLGGQLGLVDKRTVAVGFMGEVTTWLAVSRLYLESQRDMITRHYGKESQQLSRYRQVTRAVFDSNDGYRFLYNLRDYAQHCGPPLGGLTLTAGEDGTTRLELYLSRSDLLLASFQWSKHAKQLLDDWPEEVLLLPLIAEAMEGFQQVEDEVLRTLMERCGALIEVMNDGIDRVTAALSEGHPAISRLPDENSRNLLWQTFPDPSSLSALGLALQEPDPAAAARSPMQTRVDRPLGHLHAESQAAAVVGTWLEHGPGDELVAAINHVVEADQGITPLVSGLVNLCAYLLAMLSQSIGTSAEALLGGFVKQVKQDNSSIM